MIQLPRFLPLFSTEALVTPEAGKQDRVEIEVEKWSVCVFNREEANEIFRRIGPPPTISRGSRLREDHGEAYGWIFNAVPQNLLQSRLEGNVRASELRILQANGTLRVIEPPLFEGACEWKIQPAQIEPGEELEHPSIPAASEHTDEEDGFHVPEEPLIITAKLKLILNPTRHFRYHSVVPPSRGLRESLQKYQLPPAPFQECSIDGNDNWVPLNGRRWARLTASGWTHHVARYLTAVETAFEQELSRVCAEGDNSIGIERSEQKYNVKEVETYWEWLSHNPLKIVDDLIPHLRTFSRRFQNDRVYEPLDQSTENGVRILRIQTSPGEWLKIYAKTNLRIRIEVTHQFRKARLHKFQFPREIDAQGNVRRTSAHTFTSIGEVQHFFGRLQTRAAHTVNQFLQHVNRQARIEPSHISAYNALFNVARAIPDDYPTSLTLLSLLIHQGGIPSGGDAAKRQGIIALRAYGIIEPSGRRMYVPTAAYRLPFQTLRAQADFTLLIARVRTRNRPIE